MQISFRRLHPIPNPYLVKNFYLINSNSLHSYTVKGKSLERLKFGKFPYFAKLDSSKTRSGLILLIKFTKFYTTKLISLQIHQTLATPNFCHLQYVKYLVASGGLHSPVSLLQIFILSWKPWIHPCYRMLIY